MEYWNYIDTILEYATKQGFSDIHLKTDSYIKIRNKNWEIDDLIEFETDWKIQKLEILSIENIRGIIKTIIWEDWYTQFKETYELDTSYTTKGNSEKYRVNVYHDSEWYSIAFRTIPKIIPSLAELWLWDNIKELCHKSKWLVLVTGPTWSWKSTNLASMIDYINSNFKKHIITIEDPVEFVLKSKKSLVNQREVWHHTKWFDNAIKSLLREDPDIIMIWEMRDLETIKAAITLAETWHLVFSTLHTNDSVQSIDRIIDVFSSSQQKQIRMQLAMSLVWIVSQRLVSRSDKPWRVPAREVLITNDAVRNLIITGKAHHLYSVLEVWQKEWMILMDKYLIALYKKWIIDKDTLYSYIRDKDSAEMLLN